MPGKGFPSDQGGYEGACVARSASSNPGFHQPVERQGARWKDAYEIRPNFIVGSIS